MRVDTLSSRPSTSPRTRTAAAPSTTSSGVEYFIGIHLPPLWNRRSRSPCLEPALEGQHGLNVAAGVPAAIGQRTDRRVEPVAIHPAALDDLELGHGQHR